ncbi:hypothetical protein J6590_008280 [Homalodisca vitripennis]|nr:hypothetical protein J6590_008280 [Homalodisca vitripennis]
MAAVGQGHGAYTTSMGFRCGPLCLSRDQSNSNIKSKHKNNCHRRSNFVNTIDRRVSNASHYSSLPINEAALFPQSTVEYQTHPIIPLCPSMKQLYSHHRP